MTDREKFEAWLTSGASELSKMLLVDKFDSGGYSNNTARIQWEAWQAALASQQPADDGWVELEEGAIPVHPETLVEIKMRNGATDGPGKAGGFLWYIGNDVRDEMGCDIIAYRVVKP